MNAIHGRIGDVITFSFNLVRLLTRRDCRLTGQSEEKKKKFDSMMNELCHEAYELRSSSAFCKIVRPSFTHCKHRLLPSGQLCAPHQQDNLCRQCLFDAGHIGITLCQSKESSAMTIFFGHRTSTQFSNSTMRLLRSKSALNASLDTALPHNRHSIFFSLRSANET